MSLNKTFLNIFFFFLCGLIMALAAIENKAPNNKINQNNESKRNSNSRFSNLVEPRIFHLDEGVPSIFLSGSLARVNLTSDDAELEKPIGRSFNGEKEPINYHAEKGLYNKKKSELILEKDVSIIEGDSTLNASKVIYKLSKDEIWGEGDVSLKAIIPNSKDTIYIKANRFSHFPKRKISSFKENINGRIQRKEMYRDGINFETDLLDYYYEELRITLTGSVLFRRKPFSASARRGQVFLNNRNKLNYFILNDDVKLNEKIEEKGRYFFRKAFAEKMEGFPDEGKLILTGYPRVYQENEIIKGIKITVRENNQVVEVEEANTTLKLQKGNSGKNLFDSE